MGDQARLSVRREDGLDRAGGEEHPQKVSREREHVLRPVTERRDLDRHHLESVVEVLAEATFPDEGEQVAVGARDDANVDAERLAPAHRHHLRVLEEAEAMARSLQRGESKQTAPIIFIRSE